MARKAVYMNQGDLSGTGTAFMADRSEEPTGQESERP
jgi:hypothetical protein